MGCGIWQIGRAFKMQGDKCPGALQALQSLDILGSRNTRALSQCALLFGWEMEWEVDYGGPVDVCGIRLRRGKYLGHFSIFFEAIAPFVEAGSSVEIVGDDGSCGGWFFDGTSVLSTFNY